MEEAFESDDKSSDTLDEEKGIFHVTQILPAVAEAELIPDLPDAETVEEQIEPGEDSCTYQLKPDVTINRQQINVKAKSILKKFLANKTYSEIDMKDYSQRISVALREELKNMGLNRYRIVCQVTIGEKLNQDVVMTFLCLWKHDFDHYVVANYDNETFFATAVIFIVYKQ
ncbi:dynein light chain Tctex-type protein 2B-like [Parasteatoda tepidariorum]|uniref:dynein light chain Tctex-type protein 2B-like n=1 Tax=Parasteatoda tepidariorum TaxID=114398 RepID=UPI00077FB2FB|nr:dynein light chain Tctex-type protein 2B-like [Parasteatoda tepidariorum]